MSAEAEIKHFIDRVLRLKEEQDALSEDIREVYAEAKGRGYDKTAMGQVVAHLRKVDKLGSDAIAERETIFGMYLGAYETGTSVATHTHEAKNGYAVEKGIDREARRKQRMSESMDDSIALSAEAVALGLIDPAAHEETVRIADAVARKFGNGPLNEQIDPDTGEITNPEAKASEDNGTHKPQDGEGVTGDASRPSVGGGTHAADTSEGANANVSVGVTAGETAPNFEPPAFLQSKPMKTARDFRPHCQKPDACGASGLQHCYSCSKLIPEKSEVA